MKTVYYVSFLGLVAIVLVFSSHLEAAKRIELDTIVATRVPVLLEFGRGWCKPCKYMKPILKDVAKAYEGSAIVTTVDMDANTHLVRAFRIRLMPTQVFLTPEGKEFFRNEGILEREQIIQVFEKMGLAAPGQKVTRQRGAASPASPGTAQHKAGRLW